MRALTILGALACVSVVFADETPRSKTATPTNIQAVPRPLKALQVDPKYVAGGNNVQGTVELIQAPGPDGVTVKLESSHPEIVWVPESVTITHGATSAETGPMVKKTFPIHTQPVQERTPVKIKARAGAQTLETNLVVEYPKMKSASINPPQTCDGNNKATVHYALTGPAPSGLRVSVRVEVRAPNGGSGSVSESETVGFRDSIGSMRLALPRCYAHDPGERCDIRGTVRIESGSQSGVQFGSGCGHPPD